MEKLIYLNLDQAEEVLESLEWCIDEYEKQDDIDREMYKTHRSTYHSIKKQLEIIKSEVKANV
tara:strand:- start:277 stop:465 length:189 start_codon:yes stop_codon:yes gene_type:complete